MGSFWRRVLGAGEVSLAAAAARGDVRAAQAALKRGEEPALATLAAAVCACHHEVARVIVDAFERRGQTMVTLIGQAAATGNVELTRALARWSTSSARHALLAYVTDMGVLPTLLRAGIPPTDEVMARAVDPLGIPRTPNVPPTESARERVRLLLEHGGNIRARVPYVDIIFDILPHAHKIINDAISSDSEKIRATTAAFMSGMPSRSLLEVAAAIGDVDVVDLLLEKGADANADGGAPLAAACAAGHAPVARRLIEGGAEVDPSAPLAQNAARSPNAVALLSLLEEHGVDLRGAKAAFLLVDAAGADNAAAIQFLLGRAAQPVAATTLAMALARAAHKGAMGAAKALLAAGAAVDGYPMEGAAAVHMVPLVAAADAGRLAMIALLIARGAAPVAAALRACVKRACDPRGIAPPSGYDLRGIAPPSGYAMEKREYNYTTPSIYEDCARMLLGAGADARAIDAPLLRSIADKEGFRVTVSDAPPAPEREAAPCTHLFGNKYACPPPRDHVADADATWRAIRVGADKTEIVTLERVRRTDVFASTITRTLAEFGADLTLIM